MLVRPGDQALVSQINDGLCVFHHSTRKLPGIQSNRNRVSFVAQIIESIRRVKYVSVIEQRRISARRKDPNDNLFDPLKAAILFKRRGEFDEAFWMIFFFVHFGKHRRGGWRYARDVYGRLGNPTTKWDWAETSREPEEFLRWLNAHKKEIKNSLSPGGFGNHRKYEILDAYGNRGTGAAFTTYIEWVAPPRTHLELMNEALQSAGQNPQGAFNELYRSMGVVARFGRTARFDYLNMVAKLNLSNIQADSTYMQGSTGPLSGARLLFGAAESPMRLDRWLTQLEAHLGVGMQVLEDALCNWQKSPTIFQPFRE